MVAAGFLGLWIVTAAIGLALYGRCPEIDENDPSVANPRKANTARDIVRISGFIPCFGYNLPWVIGAYIYYRKQAKQQPLGADGKTLSDLINKPSDGTQLGVDALFVAPDPGPSSTPGSDRSNPFLDGPST